ncbi:hypothetical protein [Pseudoalteromonas sp. MMG012]|uniref:hypothetical protein n=1 Tax=Pseudoalteromonas sp. MMG012 TaxID=2822686 RepID=UPI001B3A1808|nr:hypothetical protein [Pseudoalteromonas sp. MMG012]MBQ4850869.1 hypothetical protein [Pseudoalteromonas sp. MMG012]
MLNYKHLIWIFLLGGCVVTNSTDKSAKPELVNELRALAWFDEQRVEEVIQLHQQQKVYGLIALNRRGYFYPKIGMSRKPLKLKAGCMTWLLSSSSDVITSDSNKELRVSQQKFSSRFNEAMAPNCLE